MFNLKMVSNVQLNNVRIRSMNSFVLPQVFFLSDSITAVIAGRGQGFRFSISRWNQSRKAKFVCVSSDTHANWRLRSNDSGQNNPGARKPRFFSTVCVLKMSSWNRSAALVTHTHSAPSSLCLLLNVRQTTRDFLNLTFGCEPVQQKCLVCGFNYFPCPTNRPPPFPPPSLLLPPPPSPPPFPTITSFLSNERSDWSADRTTFSSAAAGWWSAVLISSLWKDCLDHRANFQMLRQSIRSKCLLLLKINWIPFFAPISNPTQQIPSFNFRCSYICRFCDQRSIPSVYQTVNQSNRLLTHSQLILDRFGWSSSWPSACLSVFANRSISDQFCFHVCVFVVRVSFHFRPLHLFGFLFLLRLRPPMFSLFQFFFCYLISHLGVCVTTAFCLPVDGGGDFFWKLLFLKQTFLLFHVSVSLSLSLSFPLCE